MLSDKHHPYYFCPFCNFEIPPDLLVEFQDNPSEQQPKDKQDTDQIAPTIPQVTSPKPAPVKKSDHNLGNQKRTVNCTDCGGVISRKAVSCPHCGSPEPFGEANEDEGNLVTPEPPSNPLIKDKPEGKGFKVRKDKEKEGASYINIFLGLAAALVILFLIFKTSSGENSIEDTAEKAFELFKNEEFDALGEEVLVNGMELEEARDSWRIRLSITWERKKNKKGKTSLSIDEYLNELQLNSTPEQQEEIAEMDSMFPSTPKGLNLEKFIEKEVSEDIDDDFRDSVERKQLVELYEQGQKMGINWSEAKFEYVDLSEWETTEEILADADAAARKHLPKGFEAGAIWILFSENGSRYKFKMGGTSLPKWGARMRPPWIIGDDDGIQRVE